ncbi:MAG: aminomethyl-transferring glycine dehydrogenase subunit GcvPB [bacterium]|jgi:glycine dehydrogenase subunit 2
MTHVKDRLIFEESVAGRRGVKFPKNEFGASFAAPEALAPAAHPFLPEVSELDVVRHYTRLSQRTFGVDTGFYPLGSCTMKYNPRLTDAAAALAGLAFIHPSQPPETVPGAIEMLAELSEWLCEVTGMDEYALQPAAGAQGEFSGMLVFRKYFDHIGEPGRNIMIVPDSAHGTNPASANVAGFKVVEIKSDERGLTDPAAVKVVIEKFGAESIAGIMLTNPNTLGLFETHILEIANLLHGAGALLYYDGANLNALLGIVRPGDTGFDLMHLNTHKSFSTPHGGGGPGAGPIGVKAKLAPFLPGALFKRVGDEFNVVYPEHSIGRVKSWWGNFLVLVRAYAYLIHHGAPGLKRISENAIINANYVQSRLKGYYDIPYFAHCMHEFVASAETLKRDFNVSAKDIDKKLLEEGFHAPTTYFPLIVHEALMIEPTETESKETLDAFCDTMIGFIARIKENADEFRKLNPLKLQIVHPDETKAARQLVPRWFPVGTEPSADKAESKKTTEA